MGRSPADTQQRRRLEFESLTQGRLDRAYRMAAALLDDPDEAEDAVQEAAERAWRGWASLRNPDRFAAWFDQILVNGCRDRLRRRRFRRPADLETAELLPGSGPDASERDALERALASLDPDHRIVVMLRYLHDLTIEDIAIRTGTRVGTVKSRLHYALRELRAAYEAAERVPGENR